jgi:hypothetical protein
MRRSAPGRGQSCTLSCLPARNRRLPLLLLPARDVGTHRFRDQLVHLLRIEAQTRGVGFHLSRYGQRARRRHCVRRGGGLLPHVLRLPPGVHEGGKSSRLLPPANGLTRAPSADAESSSTVSVRLAALKVDTAPGREPADGRLLLGVANRSGRWLTRFATSNKKSQENQRVDRNLAETGHFPKYPSQNGTSSSVIP